MTLDDLPAGFTTTRQALHQLAFFAVSPARYAVEGRMGLRPTPGGFGTPEFQGTVARVEGDMLVFEKEGNVASRTITTVREAAQFFGGEYRVDWFEGFRDPLRPIDPDMMLQVEDSAARAIGHWFDFGFDVLGKLAAQAVETDEVSEVQLWPEHFDGAVELGRADEGRRASFGLSPGDDEHPEPYAYVSAWGEIDRSTRYWNDEAFNGASLPFAVLRDSDDPVAVALDFLLQGYGILHTS
jgi:hypothetical protein